MTNSYYINELHSDLRGVKEGWYAIDERGRLLFGPFSNQEICLTKSASQRRTNVESKVYLLNPWRTDARNKFWPNRISTVALIDA